MRKRIKTGLRVGGGPPPGFQWHVDFLTAAEDEARGFLTNDQYEHIVDQIRALAREPDPTHPQTVSVDSLGDGLHELRDKGGPLGNINVRVFFVIKEPGLILIVGSRKKENDGKTPPPTRKLMLWRSRRPF